MKITQIARNDWAGWGYKMNRAVNEFTEHESRLIDFGGDYYTQYEHDIHNPDVKTLGDMCEWADVIVVYDDADLLIPLDREWRPILQVYHGTWYRARPEHVSKRAKRRGYVTACTTHDLTQWGAEWIPVAIEKMEGEPRDEFTVIHAPTKRAARGTDRVIQSCKAAGVNLDLIEGVSHKECLERKAKGDVLIDSTSDGLGISYGVNAVEAWAMNMPVISYSKPEVRKKIESSVGGVPFYQSDDLSEALTKFRDDKDLYAKWQKRGRDAWKRFHRPEEAARHFCHQLLRAKDHAGKPEPLSVSVTMIVKDEEDCLGDALESTKGLADEVVVVDTGSKDKTVEIAEDFGAKVVIDGDRYNKGGERNHAIREAKGDWVVILDADEIIAEPEKVWEHIQLTYHHGLMVRTTYMSGEKEGLSFHQQRCWQKGSFWYKYHAHELPLPEGDMTAEHVPYVWEHRPPGDRWGWKTKYTLDRIKLDVEEYPDDARPLYYLGRQYRYMSSLDDYAGKKRELEDKAIETLEKYIETVKDKKAWDLPNAYYDLSLLYQRRKQFTNRFWALHGACRAQPSNKRWWFELAQTYWETGARELALGLGKAVLELPSERQGGYKIPALDGPVIYDRLAMWCWNLGRYQEGREYVKEALAKAPGNERLVENLRHFDRVMNE